jgi:DNA-binding protein H-NS
MEDKKAATRGGFFSKLATRAKLSLQRHVMKRRDCNFESMSTAELWDLYNELGSKLAVKLEAEANLLQQRLDEIQRRASLSPMGGTDKRKQGAAAKFRNPKPPFQTWSGRGAQPPWVRDALKHGKTIDSLRIEVFVLPSNEEAYPA